MIYLSVFAVCAVGSFIQAVSGFGAAIFMMLFFPFLMPITTATALSGIACLGSNITNSIEYRKHIEWKSLPLPTIAFFVLSFVTIRLVKVMDTGLLKKIFGIVLIALALYFLFAPKRTSIKKPSSVLSLSCGALSGVTGGMFGASGPPMVMYLLAATKSKESYLGTLQMFSLITGLWSFGVRVLNHYYTVEMIPMLILGIVGVLFGQFIGIKVVNKISAKALRNCVNVLLLICGVINLFQ